MEKADVATFAERMLEAIPELKSRYNRECYWGIEDQGPHIVCATTLNPYLDELLDTASDGESLRRVFEYIEQLATHPDPDIRGVVRVTICEHLGADPVRLERARAFMGPATLNLSQEIEEFWGKDHS